MNGTGGRIDDVAVEIRREGHAALAERYRSRTPVRGAR